MDQLKPMEIRVKYDDFVVREESTENETKMILEGYPIRFDKEAYVFTEDYIGYEKILHSAFDNCDMSDTALKYNHNDNMLILARVRNGSLQLKIDEEGVFAHAELIDTTQNRDVYKMVKAGLLTEGSFAFAIRKDSIIKDAEGETHRVIEDISYLADVAICPMGAYGSLTEWHARKKAKVETNAEVETERHSLSVLRLRNANKLKLMEVKYELFRKKTSNS